jgi:hypothetical protein
MTDDLGHADILGDGCQQIPTPYVASPADGRGRFTDAYANEALGRPTLRART